MMSVRPKFYIVLGPYRSGTSLVSRLAHKLGADPGPESGLFEATAWNPSGYIQRPDITAFNTELIVSTGGTLTRPCPPEEISKRTDPSHFNSLSLDWTRSTSNVLAKDPRFCFTLLAWMQHGVFADFDLALIRITRDIKQTAASALAHYDVKNYCENSFVTAQEVITRYDQAAHWHEVNLRVPCHTITYEDLINEPPAEVSRLAGFMGVSDTNLISSAIAATLEGKSRISHDLSG